MKQITNIALFVYAYLLVVLKCSDNSAAYPCNVADCQRCSGPNFCGLCNNGFILQMNYNTGASYCQYLQCNIPNCRSCLTFNQCQLCSDGYNVSTKGSCVSSSSVYTNCPSNCLSCSDSSTCTRCKYGYNPQSGVCEPNNGALVPNCQAYFTGFTCQLCNPNYMVAPSYQCTSIPSITCNVSNCYFCQRNNYCQECQAGYQLTANGTCVTLTCEIDNCIECGTSNTSQCITCYDGYEINDGGSECQPRYVGCTIENCLVCMENSEQCAVCVQGYTPVSYTVGSACVQLTSSTANYFNISEIFYYPVTNCAKYGQTIFGTSILQTGCVVCNDGFILNAGYCVANLTLSKFTCNIPNCAYCTQNNYCGQCVDGFISYMGNYQQCIPYYSGQNNCRLTALFTSVCAICDQGYTLYNDVCTKSWMSNMCNITGCEYCLQENNCQECRDGYITKNGTCEKECEIQNCWECLNSSKCTTCNYGYTLVNSSSACQLTSTISKSDCTTFSPNCTSCNMQQCTACANGYTLSGSTCCPTPAQDVYGCAVYENSCSNICIQCQLGFNIVQLPYFNFSTQCLNVPCGVSNCVFCQTSNTCGICAQNYTVSSNGTCISYTPNCQVENCQECYSNGTCNVCLNGFLNYEGQCVCPIQNCLKCMGYSYCSVCAYPMVSEFGINSQACLPEVIPNTFCNIPNCVECQNQKYCAVCDYGFTLTSSGTCTQNQCDPQTSCSLCGLNNTQCYLCNYGYIQQSYTANQCFQMPKDYTCSIFGCEFCETSDSSCLKCYDTFYKGTDGLCHQNGCVDNCLVCYDNNTCTVCMNGFYRSKNSRNQITCQPINTNTSSNCSGINYCTECNKNGTLVSCLACHPGLMPNQQRDACVPQVCEVPNCQLCMPASQLACLACKQGYYPNPYYQCVPFNTGLTVAQCNVYNCLICSSNNTCAKCLVGWNRTEDGTCVTEKFCQINNCGNCTYENICYNCMANYTLLSSSLCSPTCNIANCGVCQNFTTCQTCNGDLIPSEDKKSCICNQTFINITATTCACPDHYTLYGGSCYNCSAAGNCSVCSADNVCETCDTANGFKKINGSCVCPDDTFVFTNNSCLCLNSTTLYNSTCVPCDVELCKTCSTENTCITCDNNLKVDNGTCGCPESFKQTDDDFCVCEEDGAKPNQAGTQCFPCDIAHCQYCSNDDTCSNCVATYTLVNSTSCGCPEDYTESNNTCYLCTLQYCQTCNATNYCQTCEDTFTLVNGTCVCTRESSSRLLVASQVYQDLCIQCSLDNCNYCQEANICAECEPTYFKTSEGVCISCNINNCLECSSAGFCSQCNSSLSLDVSAEGSACLHCDLSNCSSCFSNGSCAICESGYSLAANTINCVQCSVTGCSLCKDHNVCAVCQLGYSLNSQNQCTTCSYPCATCGEKGCVTCQSPYSLYSSSNGTCYSCTTQNCLTCDISSPNKCLSCPSGYNLQNGSCVYNCKDSNCLECFFNNICTICGPGYVANGTSSCTRCSSTKCISCSASNLAVCYQCSTGYYLVNGTCTLCPQPYCETCTASGCLTFKKSTGLLSLNINSASGPNAIYPVVCDPACSTCSTSDPTYCLTCPTGYSSQSGQCNPCGPNCRTCSNSNTSYCYSCFSNANLQNNTCVSCTGNCLTCSSTNSSSCLTCMNGYFLGTSKTCTQECPALCKSCSNSTYCTACNTGYSPSFNGTCLPCLSNCRQCAASSPSTCLSCGYGFYLSQSSCVQCPAYCKSCNFAGCTECSAGYSLTSTLTCAQTCVPPCLTCSETNPFLCFNCMSGYTYNSSQSKCVPSPLVVGGVTYYCPFGTVLSNNKCNNCTGSNCARCNPNSLGSCTSCLYGYYFVSANNTCNTCPSKCLTCSSSTKCMTCETGYVVAVQDTQSSSVCQACQAPCSTCMNTPQTCTACVEGFKLVGWKCLTSFNIGFNLTLDSTLENFNTIYYEYLLALASALNSTDIDILLMSLIESGSVLNNGNYTIATTPDNSIDAYSSISTLLGENSQIAGMSVLSSSVTVNGGTIPDDNNSSSGPNLGLILGICIPVGIILIGILVYCLCIRKRASYPPVNYSVNSKDTTVRQTFELTREDPM